MKIVTLAEAHVQLSKLIEMVKTGEVVTITNDGHPIARMVPVPGKRFGKINMWLWD